MAKTSEKYEVLYIIDQDVDEEGVKALVEKFTALINEHGAVVEADEWGKRKLAYPINDKPEGELSALLSPSRRNKEEKCLITS